MSTTPFTPEPEQPLDAASDLSPETDTPPYGFKNKNATLLLRLGEAVDGYRDSPTVVFLGPYAYNPNTGGHRLVGPFPDVGPAQKYARDNAMNAHTHGLFGPYDGSVSSTVIRDWRVVRVDLQLVGPNGQTATIRLDGKVYDCVCWSASAVDKFLVPYYTALGSLEEGKVVRDTINQRETVAMAHLPGSEWVDVDYPKTDVVAGSEHGVGLYVIKPDSSQAEGFKAQTVL